MITRTGVFLVVFLGVFSAVHCDIKCPGVAEYELSFWSMWSNKTHPNAFPDMGKFSPLVGCSHNMYYTMWNMGMQATQGVKDVAETGDTTAMKKEIMERIMYNKTAWKLIEQAGGPIDGNGSHVQGIKVEVTADYPMVSLISMLVPSPDWFTGIKVISLCNNGMWRDSLDVATLHPWDAGTEDGNMFNMTNAASSPQQNITIITKDSGTPFKGDPIATLGRLMFKRVNKPAMSQCSGEQTYTVEFQGMWTKERQPKGFPNNAHFSPLIGCTHKYTYKFWSPMKMASAGVQKVAETGNPDTLYNELKAVMAKPGYIYKIYKADGTTEGAESRKMEIMVKDMYSMVSIITMLAPSPDWFAGVDSLNLCGSDGWKEKAEMSLPAWDAGTDDGEKFVNDNVKTMPQDVIKLITKDSKTEMMGNTAIKDFAKITFTKKAGSEPAGGSAYRPCASVSVFMSVAFLAILRFLY